MTTETLAPAAAPVPMPVEAIHARVAALRKQVGHAFIGQVDIFDQVLMSLLAAGHVLIEGVPGLGKTLPLGTMT